MGGGARARVHRDFRRRDQHAGAHPLDTDDDNGLAWQQALAHDTQAVDQRAELDLAVLDLLQQDSSLRETLQDAKRSDGTPMFDLATCLSLLVFYVLAITSIGVYGIVLAGWASGSTYPLLGGLRSSAQVVSYEIAMALCFAAVFLYSGTMSTSGISPFPSALNWW